MSHNRIKTKFVNCEYTGEEETVYADFNNSCDVVTFFRLNSDGEKEIVLSVEDTLRNNLLEAIWRLYSSDEGVEPWSESELKTIK